MFHTYSLALVMNSSFSCRTSCPVKQGVSHVTIVWHSTKNTKTMCNANMLVMYHLCSPQHTYNLCGDFMWSIIIMKDDNDESTKLDNFWKVMVAQTIWNGAYICLCSSRIRYSLISRKMLCLDVKYPSYISVNYIYTIMFYNSLCNDSSSQWESI